jgi:hypothetical protein
MRNGLAWVALAGALVACKKEVVDTGPTGSCDDLETANLETIPVDEWPENLDATLDPYNALPGTYTADSCAGPITVKLDKFPPKEEIAVFSNTVDSRLPCGCASDPEFPDSDNALGATASAYGTTAFFDSADDTLDPGMEQRLFTTVDWAFFPSSAPFLLRGCETVPADTTGTAGWKTALVALRVDSAGTLSGNLSLSGSGDPYSCDLSGFVKTLD